MSCPMKASYPATYSGSAPAKQMMNTVVASYGGSGYYQQKLPQAPAGTSSYRTLGSYMLGGSCCQPHIMKLCSGANCNAAPSKENYCSSCQ